MEENNINLNNLNGASNNQNSGAKPSAPSFSSTPSQTTATSQYSSSGYIRPEDIVRGPSTDANKPKASPVFAYSKQQPSNPYLPSGYTPTTPVPEVQTPNNPTMQNAENAGFSGQTLEPASLNSGASQNSEQVRPSGDLSFTENSTSSSSNFEVVGNKTPTAVSRSKKTNLKKLNASRRTESRFCGHFAWFFSISNLFVCLFFILVNILLSQVSGEGAQESDIVITLNSIIKMAPYVTLVVCAFTLIALINSIVQLTIRVNKYSKVTIIVVLLLSIVAFVYLYFVGYLGETLKLLNLVTS